MILDLFKDPGVDLSTYLSTYMILATFYIAKNTGGSPHASIKPELATLRSGVFKLSLSAVGKAVFMLNYLVVASSYKTDCYHKTSGSYRKSRQRESFVHP